MSELKPMAQGVVVVMSDLPISEGTIREPVKGTKTDKYKPRWSLLPIGTVNEVIKVLEFGAVKYSVGNWMHVPDAKTRYYDATMRHLEAWVGGEWLDTESGLPHLAHAVCCILFLLWLNGEK